VTATVTVVIFYVNRCSVLLVKAKKECGIVRNFESRAKIWCVIFIVKVGSNTGKIRKSEIDFLNGRVLGGNRFPENFISK